MKLGYARVSTAEQNLDRQIDELKRHECDRIYAEKVTGTTKDRPELQRLIEQLRPGDILMVTELSRLGRNTKGLLELIDSFKDRNVDFISLKESLDTSSPFGKAIFTIVAALAQLERDIISQRTVEGLASARARGRSGGRPRIPQKHIDLALKMYDNRHYTFAEIKEATGVGKSTLYRYIKIRDIPERK